MQKKKLKHYDFKRYLKQSKYLFDYFIQYRNEIFCIDHEKINIENIFSSLYTKDLQNNKLWDLSAFKKFFSISDADIRIVDKELMNDLGYAIKGLEWWGKRRNVQEVLPSQYIVKHKLEPQIVNVRKRKYVQLKKWFSKTKNENNDTNHVCYLIPEEEWKPIEAQLRQASFPKQYFPYVILLKWLNKEQSGFRLQPLIQRYSCFEQDFEHYTSQEKSKYIHTLNYIFGKSDFYTDDHYSILLRADIHELREKLKQVDASQKIGKNDIDDFNYIFKLDISEEKTGEYTYKDMFNLIAYGVNKKYKKQENEKHNILHNYIRFCTALFYHKEIASLPEITLKAFMRINDLKDTANLLKTIKELKKIEYIDTFLLLVAKFPDCYDNNNSSYAYELITKLLNYGIDSRYILAFYRYIKYSREIANCAKNPEALMCYTEYLDQVLSIPEFANRERELVKEFPFHNIVEIDQISLKVINRFLANIKSIISCLEQVDNPVLLSILAGFYDWISLGIENNSLHLLDKWLDPPKKDVTTLELPENLESLREKINNLVYFRNISGEKGIPYSLIRILSGKSNIIKQLNYIEGKLEDEPDNETLRIRWNNLTQYLSDFEKIQLKEFENKLDNSLAIARIESLRTIISQLYDLKLKGIVPDSDKIMQSTNFKTLGLFIKFYTNVSENKKILDEVLETYCKSGEQYKLDLERNKKWLKKVEKSGLNIQRWLNTAKRKYDVKDEEITIYEENNPFEIFMMGYYFDTCLSIPSGDYAESVIINAADINKKVIYAKNRKGDVIGRKLLALSVDHRLLGFNSYGKDMEGVFNKFSFTLANECNIRTSNTGEPEQIHPGEWYDDGLELFDWSKLIASDGKKTSGFPFHTDFEKYYKNNAQKIIKDLEQELEQGSIDRIGERNRYILSHPLLLLELCIRFALKNHDLVFLEFALDNVPYELRKNALFSWALVKKEGAVHKLKNYIEFSYDLKNTAFDALGHLKTTRIMKELADILLKKGYLEYIHLVLFTKVEFQKEIIKQFLNLNVKNVTGTAHYDFISNLYLFNDEIIKAYLPSIFKKHMTIIKEKQEKDYHSFYEHQYNYIIYNENSGTINNALKEYAELLGSMALEDEYVQNHYDNLIRFMFYSSLDAAKQYFISILKSGKKENLEWACVYLGFHFGLRFSKTIFEHSRQDPEKPDIFLALLLTNNSKLIEKQIALIKEKYSWEGEFEDRYILNKYLIKHEKGIFENPNYLPQIEVDPILDALIIKLIVPKIRQKGMTDDQYDFLKQYVQKTKEKKLITSVLLKRFDRSGNDIEKYRLANLLSDIHGAFDDYEDQYIARYISYTINEFLKTANKRESNKFIQYLAKNECELDITEMHGNPQLLIDLIQNNKQTDTTVKFTTAPDYLYDCFNQGNLQKDKFYIDFVQRDEVEKLLKKEQLTPLRKLFILDRLERYDELKNLDAI